MLVSDRWSGRLHPIAAMSYPIVLPSDHPETWDGTPPLSTIIEGDYRYRLLVESISDYAIFILDTEGHVRTWNPGAERIKGYEPEQIIGKHFSVFYPPEVDARTLCDFELDVAKREGRFEAEGWRVRRNGSRFWANVVITALRNPEGVLVGFAKVTRDLTERREAEEQARRSRLLVESVKDYAMFVLDTEGYVRTWNPGAERIKRYKADEIIGKHFSAFYPPEVDAKAVCDLELEVAARDGRFEAEGWRVRQGGSRFWANVVITALRDPEGVLLGFAKVTRDLTDRRNAEEQAQRFRLLVESVADYAIFVLDPEGHVSTWNAGAERIKQYKAEEITGQHFSVFYPPEVDAKALCDDELEIASREGRFEAEGWRVRRDGSRFWANVVITALRNPEGVLVGFAKVTRDLTERRNAEEKMRLLAAEKAALEEKSRIQQFQEKFLAILGHDLRNPLAAIDMGLGILRQRSSDDADLRIMDRVHSSSRRMSRMIQQILDLTRSRLAGGIPVNPEPIDLCRVLNSIVDELRTGYPQAAIELQCGPLTARADSDRLEQVFSNLIGNAIVHGGKDGIVKIEAGSESRSVYVNVHNDGPPIPEHLRGSLFDPFRRGDTESRSSKTAGLGLGLYISRELIIGHGGNIEFESSPGRGTTFRVTLPKEFGQP
jgi:PAS domain S-box-containing protein